MTTRLADRGRPPDGFRCARLDSVQRVRHVCQLLAAQGGGRLLRDLTRCRCDAKRKCSGRPGGANQPEIGIEPLTSRVVEGVESGLLQGVAEDEQRGFMTLTRSSSCAW